MSLKPKPLNQNEYSMEILEELGKLETKPGSNIYARYALFKCGECEKPFKVRVPSAKAKAQTKCITCTSTTHNIATTPLYAIWNGIRQRCYNVKRKDYHKYGALGVTMCDEWKDDVAAFSSWCLSNGWVPGLVVDKDVKSRELGISPPIYSPETISFLTVKENAQEANAKAVLQYTLDGTFIKEFASCTEAALGVRGIKTAKSSIANAARGTTKTSFGFVWKFKNVGPSI